MAEKECLIAHSVYDEQREAIESALRMVQTATMADPKDVKREENRLNSRRINLDAAFYGNL